MPIAVGLLVVCGTAAGQVNPDIRALADSVSPDRIFGTIHLLESAGGWWSRVNFTPGNDTARAMVLRALTSLPGVTAELDTFYTPAAPPYDAQPLFNILARRAGETDTNAVIVIGAHYDSQAGRDTSTWSSGWFTAQAPGADDNASGVAGVLEVARLFSTEGFRNRLPVYFALFGAEEGTTPGVSSYLNGSRHLAQRLHAEGVNVIAFINLDMIGYNPIAMVGTIVADSQSQSLGELVSQLNDRYGCGLSLNAPPYASNRWSDHASFWDEGYPGILVIEHFDVVKADSTYPGNPNYHHAWDTSGVLNPALLQAFCRLALVTVAELAGEASPITGIRSPEFLPLDCSLSAYPNPFNPSLTIEVSLGKSSKARVEVFDLLGRRVALLAEGTWKPGKHRLAWTAPDGASGVYIVRAVAGGAVRSTRILLLR